MATAQTPNPLEYLNQIDSYGYDFSSISIEIYGTNIVIGGPLREYESFSWKVDNSKPEKPSTSPIVPGFGVGKAKFSGSFTLSQEQGQALTQALSSASAQYGLGVTSYSFNVNVNYGPLPGPAGGPPKFGKVQAFGCFITGYGSDESQEQISLMNFDYVCSYLLVNGSRPV